MLEGFSEDLTDNEVDRRIYFEVTGCELIEGEFLGDDVFDSSDEEWGRRRLIEPPPESPKTDDQQKQLLLSPRS